MRHDTRIVRAWELAGRATPRACPGDSLPPRVRGRGPFGPLARLSLRTAHQVNLISPLPARVPLTVDAFIALP